MSNLVWFRRDLRTQDNPALFHACQNATKGVIALFIITPQTFKSHALSAVQVAFLLENLRMLSEELALINIPLLIREAASFKETPLIVEELAKKMAVNSLYFNRQYEWDEQQRDRAVTETLSAIGCKILQFDEQVIIPPEKILNKQNEPFKVFTPFKKKWISLAELFYQPPYSKPKKQLNLELKSDPVPTEIIGFHNKLSLNSWPAGEKAANSRLISFCRTTINAYKEMRDYPAENATSRISPYLALGVLSPRQCIAAVIAENSMMSFGEIFARTGISTWVSELIWREFYKMIVFYYPGVCKNRPFKSHTEQLPWRYDENLFAKWSSGQTGFPIVDAAMRQLNQTGWMHNRLRMVTAMFLTKTLFIDWRWGERYFSEHLIDMDFSANNGGWQWSASTGTDAVPYFRIFNPNTQSERFDPDGTFIRQYCPELKHLDNKSIHDPFILGIDTNAIKYPNKIVDYKKMRAFVLAEFKRL